MQPQYTLPEVIAAVSVAVLVVLVVLVFLRERKPAAFTAVDNFAQKAELSVEGYTEGELVKLSAMIMAHLSDDSRDQSEISLAATDAAARTSSANARIEQRAAARAKVAAVLMGSKLAS